MSRKKTNGTNGHLAIKSVIPLTDNQRLTFDAFEDEKHLLLHGWAGTGKTFIALALALKEIIEGMRYSKIFIVRSAVPSRAVGYLPGDLDEKLMIFETPYVEIVNDLVSRVDGYEVLKTKKMIEFVSTSYLRGITMDNCIVIVDEIQNMQFHELDTIITRAGKNIRLIMAGDYHQTDLVNGAKMDCLGFMEIIRNLKEFQTIEFTMDDIVRNDLVRSYLIAKEKRSVFQRI